MSRPLSARMQPARAPAQHHPSPANDRGATGDEEEDDQFALVDDDEEEDDDEIDLDGYEAYLDDIKRKAEARPQSARLMRPYPTESPQFYMVNATNPVNPVDLSSVNKQATSRGTTRPAVRPMSARPRINSGEETLRPTVPLPRAPQTARPSSASAGARRRRQGSAAGSNTATDALNARIRGVYNDVGRTPSAAGSISKANIPVVSASHAATSVLQNRLKVFQDADLQHEHHRLVDVVADLRSVMQHEQSQRLKAMARVRRLEEIVTMKDKKIESLLHAQGSVTLSGHGPDSSSFAALVQREMAQKERLHHAVMQKLRHKLAQQSQILASYEEAMQALRANIKSTCRMEMEEETQQLSIEVARLHDIISALQAQLELQDRKLVEVMGGDAQYQAQLGRLQQELKRNAHEKHKLEQETMFLKANVHQLEHKLALEQKKRVYDQAVASGGRMLSGSRSPSSSAKSSPRVLFPSSSFRSPTSTANLAEALAELKVLKATPSSPPLSSPVKTRRPAPLPTQAQMDLCEAGDAEELRHDDDPEDVTAPVEMSDEPVTSRPDGLPMLASVLKSPVAPVKKHVRWQTDAEEEGEEESVEGVVSAHAKEEVEQANELRSEVHYEGVEDTNITEDPKRVEQETTSYGGGDEDHKMRIGEDGLLDKKEEKDDGHEEQESREMEEDIHHRDTACDEEEEEEEGKEEDPASNASLARTNSTDSSESSHSDSTSSSSSFSHSASSASTSSAGSSSLSSLLAQEDAATMALEAAAQKKAAEDPLDITAEDTEPEDLQYASDFSDTAAD